MKSLSHHPHSQEPIVRKIRLDPEALAVQSFATIRAPRTRGTVRGAESDPLVEAPSWNVWDCATEANCLSWIEECVESHPAFQTCSATCAGMPGC